MIANMAEGIEQSSDAGVAKYLFTSKGSVAEVVTRLQGAERRGWTTTQECRKCVALSEEIGRMLGGWIKYLARCDFKDRGRYGQRGD